MINLGRCLAYLLESHDYVALNGVGTFKRDHFPARFDEPSNTFYPPFYELNFVADGGTGPGSELIIDYIVAQRNVERDLAQSSYRRSLSVLLSDLTEKGSAELDGLGTLVQEGDVLRFEPSDLSELDSQLQPRKDLPHLTSISNTSTTANTGTPVEIAVTNLEAESGDVAKQINVEKFEVADFEEIKLDLPDGERELEHKENNQDEVAEEQDSRGSRFWPVLGWAVVIVGALAAITSFLRPDLLHSFRVAGTSMVHSVWPSDSKSTNNEESSKELAAAPLETLTDSLDNRLNAAEDVPSDSSLVNTIDPSANANTLEEILARDANAGPEGANSKAPKPAGPQVTYEIIVASFKTMQQAEDFVNEMKTKGIQLRAIESLQPRNRKKVSYGSYATKEEAYRDLPKVQKTVEPTAWVDKIVR